MLTLTSQPSRAPRPSSPRLLPMANTDHAEPRRNGHRWHPIEDLPPGLQRSEELRTLFELWRSQRDELEQAKKLAEFSERLIRAWCIETGILERTYPIDQGITLTLIEQCMDAASIPQGASELPPAQLVSILGDHCEAIDGLFAFEGNRELSSAYVKALHHAMTGRQDECEATDSLCQLLRGEWKRLPDNPVDPASGVALHEYCPPEQVAIEMDNLMRMHRGHAQIAPEIEAAWLHHRCTQIHPFRDGNERVAGTLATLVFLRAGGFPLVVRASDRSEYVGALEWADAGDLQPLIALFARLQQFGILGALALGQQVLAEGTGMPAIVRNAPFRIRDALLEPARAVETATARLSDPPAAETPTRLGLYSMEPRADSEGSPDRSAPLQDAPVAGHVAYT
jgi:hypothetical protein